MKNWPICEIRLKPGKRNKPIGSDSLMREVVNCKGTMIELDQTPALQRPLATTIINAADFVWLASCGLHVSHWDSQFGKPFVIEVRSDAASGDLNGNLMASSLEANERN